MTAAEEWRPVIGDTLHGWTFLEVPAKLKDKALCRCECGAVKSIVLDNILRGRSKRCRSCSNRIIHTTHGASDIGGKKADRLYTIWKGMKNRCSPGEHWAGYYDKGIRVCEEWMNAYPAFREWALANGYRDGLTIDRFPDKRGNYEPGNCRWADYSQQARNTSRNVYLTAFGETKMECEWIEDPRCMVNRGLLSMRRRRGWTHEEAIATPPLSTKRVVLSRRRSA